MYIFFFIRNFNLRNPKVNGNAPHMKSLQSGAAVRHMECGVGGSVRRGGCVRVWEREREGRGGEWKMKEEVKGKWRALR